eukprot:3470805-Amphidinium_carterae.1
MRSQPQCAATCRCSGSLHGARAGSRHWRSSGRMHSTRRSLITCSLQSQLPGARERNGLLRQHSVVYKSFRGQKRHRAENSHKK